MFLFLEINYLLITLLFPQVYRTSGLVVAEDHILYSIGKLSSQLKMYGPSLEAYTRLVDARTRVNAPSQQTANQQAAYLREFITLYKLIEDARPQAQQSDVVATKVEGADGYLPELPALPIPWLKPQQLMVLLDTSTSARVCGAAVSKGLECGNPASGVTFSNCLPEHREAWAGMQRLVVEKVFESLTRPVPPQLLSADTDNTRVSQLPVGEPCCLKLPVYNPLLISFTISEPKLLITFVPDDETGSDNNHDSCVTIKSAVNHFVMAPNEEIDLIFELSSSKLGHLIIKGVQYKLNLTPESGNEFVSSCAMILGSQKIQVKGPRLNNSLKHRSSVTYAADKRLELNIVPSLPRIDVNFSELPERLLCGEMVKIDVVIQNTGSIPVTGLYLANGDPRHTFFVTESPSNVSNHVDFLSPVPVNTSLPSEKSTPGSCRLSYVQQLAVQESLAVGATVRGTLYLRAQLSPGTQHIMLLFYCHAPHQKLKYR